MPKIAAVGTAVPPYQITQAESRDFAKQLFGRSFRDIDRLLQVFESAQIAKRHFCTPLDWFSTAHSWQEKNALYVQHAIALATTAVQTCLQRAGVAAEEIDCLLFVSSTGLATPSLDAHLFNTLGLHQGIKRLPIWGLGCAGGAAGLARGFDLASAHPKSKVIVCCVELCGLTFLHGDRSKSNLIATSLFADGAAAALILGDETNRAPHTEGPRLLGSRSTIWPDSLDVMGWEVEHDGLKVVFSKDIPSIVQTKISPQITAFLEQLQLTRADLTRFIAHPGGMKVLLAYEEAFGLPTDTLRHSRAVLREYGNMSSSTVLFVLERELQETHAPGEHGLVLSLGPGFSCEQVMLRW